MRKIAVILLTLSLATACVPQTPAPPPTPQPATVTESAPPSPAATATSLLATDTPSPTPPPPDAAAFPDPALYTWETVVSGLERPADIQSAIAGAGRLFLAEKVGRILILQDGQVLSVPFLDISERVGSQGNEQGLLGLAFHPRYAENGFFYVNYTGKDGNTVIARFQASPHLGLANPASERVLLRVNQPFANHNGGALAFGADGYLYAGLGDGGSAGDPFGNAQNLTSLLGKILRLDVDSAEPYAIPPGNISGSEVWAYGLRNPWRISVDRATGDLYIGDVGQNEWEEIDFVAAGTPGLLNFGWDYMEGTHAYEGFPPLDLALVAPAAEYNHDQGCSVTGGVVYRGAMPEWQGIYLYADYCRGTIWGLLDADGQWQARALFEAGLTVTTFGQDEMGEVYLASDNGQVSRLVRR
ncbi:MAG: PQQ-dependent sugar dehydrogenase [Chloroflexota bacterium]